MSDVLMLNANGEPLSHVPLSVINWQDAIRLVFLGKVKVLKEYEHWIVRSQYLELKVPSVVIMTSQVKWNKTLKYSRNNIFLRDDFTCQLQTTWRCKEMQGKVKLSELTLDHVIPRASGGKTNWANMCTSCKSCNSNKGSDETILPIKMPYKPTYYEILAKRKKLPIQIRDEDWKFYINWPDNLVKVLPQPDANGHIG